MIVAGDFTPVHDGCILGTLVSMGPSARRFITAVALLALVPYLLLFRLEAQTHLRGTQRDEDIYFTPEASTLPFLSLGYRRALASVLWTQALIYFGDQVANRGHFRHLLERTDAILALDPAFRDIYEWIAVVAVYNAGAISRQDIETSNRYLERGVRRFPRDGELLYMLAFNYAIELPTWTDDPEEKRRLRRTAAELFARASGLPGAPADAAIMAAEMGKRGGDRALAVAYVRRLLATVSDDRVRDQLIVKLRMLTSEEEAEEADADRRRQAELWARDWPYLPAALFALVGERIDRQLADEPGDSDEQER